MFILEQTLRSSSPVDMAFDPDSSSKKRKRGSEQFDDVIAHSLSVLAQGHDSGHQELPTPPHSSFSTLVDLSFQCHPRETSSPTLSTRAFPQSGEQPASKRPHIMPRTRRPPLGLPTPSSLSINTVNTYTPSVQTIISATSNAPASPCHRCRRQPSMRADLSSFAMCDFCGNVTCGVCLRQCEGRRCQAAAGDAEIATRSGSEIASGKKMCASCCVEVGVEGRVWCRPCYHSLDDDMQERGNQTIGKTGKAMQTERVGMIAAWLNECEE